MENRNKQALGALLFNPFEWCSRSSRPSDFPTLVRPLERSLSLSVCLSNLISLAHTQPAWVAQTGIIGSRARSIPKQSPIRSPSASPNSVRPSIHLGSQFACQPDYRSCQRIVEDFAFEDDALFQASARPFALSFAVANIARR